MNLKITLAIIIVITSFSSCTHESKHLVNDNWAIITDDIYYEFYFGDSVVESFNREFELQYVSSYKLINDSILIGDQSFLVETINDSIFRISNSESSLEYQKVFNNRNEFLLSDLIETGVYQKGSDENTFQRTLRRFVDSNFTIREAEYRIANGVLNKDSLLAFWESKATADSSKNSYWKYLIKRIKD